MREAVEHTVGATPTHVMRVEHLIAIALKTGRAKDFARISLLLEEATVDVPLLDAILQRHQLLPQWNTYKVRTS